MQPLICYTGFDKRLDKVVCTTGSSGGKGARIRFKSQLRLKDWMPNLLFLLQWINNSAFIWFLTLEGKATKNWLNKKQIQKGHKRKYICKEAIEKVNLKTTALNADRQTQCPTYDTLTSANGIDNEDLQPVRHTNAHTQPYRSSSQIQHQYTVNIPRITWYPRILYLSNDIPPPYKTIQWPPTFTAVSVKNPEKWLSVCTEQYQSRGPV